MLLGAALRRFSSRWIRAVGLVSATVLLCTAAGSFGVVAAAAPYPPSSPPCALSWSSNTARGSVLVGSGYDTNQPVQVTLYPQAQPLGSYAANASGAFEAPVDVPDNPRRAAVWVTATSPHRSCSVAPPSEGGTQPPASTPTDGTTAPSAGGSTTPGGAGSSNGPGGPGGPGASGNSGSGAGSGDGSGAGSGSGPTSPPYPPAGSSSSSTPGTPGTGASSAPASSAPNAPATTSPPPNADRATRALGLSLSVIVTIAVLLLLAGGLGVLVLTRRAS